MKTGSSSVSQATLDPPASASQLLGLQACDCTLAMEKTLSTSVSTSINNTKLSVYAKSLSDKVVLRKVISNIVIIFLMIKLPSYETLLTLEKYQSDRSAQMAREDTDNKIS
jgi:hypothetical protein